MPLHSGTTALHEDGSVHVDPALSARVTEELTAELAHLDAAFNPPDADELAAFYARDAILYVGTSGRFFVGRDEIRNQFFAPLVALIRSARVDMTAFRFHVVSDSLAVMYGSPSATVTLANGAVQTLAAIPQTITWLRQPGDAKRPFVIIANHE